MRMRLLSRTVSSTRNLKCIFIVWLWRVRASYVHMNCFLLSRQCYQVPGAVCSPLPSVILACALLRLIANLIQTSSVEQPIFDIFFVIRTTDFSAITNRKNGGSEQFATGWEQILLQYVLKENWNFVLCCAIIDRSDNFCDLFALLVCIVCVADNNNWWYW